MNKKIIASAIVAAACIVPVRGLATGNTEQKSSVQRYEVLVIGDKDQSGENYVAQLQKQLKYEGFFDQEPTGYYGEITQKSVMEFQEKHGMTVDGKAGPVTRRILFGNEYEAIPSSRKVVNSGGASVGEYSPGDRGPEITKIQKRLKELNYYTYGKTTEYFGPITEEAVISFKKANGLNADSGKIGQKTYNALFSDSAKKKPKTDSKKKTTTSGNKKSAKSSNSGSSKEAAVKSGNSSKAEKFVQIALAQQGDRYVLGAAGPNTFDCSGLVYYSLRQVGVSGPRTSAAQSQHSAWQKVSKSQLKRGDIVFFSSPRNSNVGHAGIYLGGGQFVHASSGSKRAVTISSLSSGSYASRFRWGRRVF